MNKYEKLKLYKLAEISEMIKYAESKNSDRDSKEYQIALWEWVHNYLEDFRTKWELEHGKLEY